MTIQFIAGFSPYEYGQIVTLSGPVETKFIAGGQARAYIPGVTDQPAVVVVVPPAVVGAKAGNLALASLLTTLATAKIITDSTT